MIEIYEENKLICEEISKLIYILRKYGFAIDALMGNEDDKEYYDVYDELIRNDNSYDIEKSLNIIRNRLEEAINKINTYDIVLYNSSEEKKDNLSCYTERFKDYKLITIIDNAHNLAKTLNTNIYEIVEYASEKII